MLRGGNSSGRLNKGKNPRKRLKRLLNSERLFLLSEGRGIVLRSEESKERTMIQARPSKRKKDSTREGRK